MCIEDRNAWCGTSYTQTLCVISFLPLLNHSILLLKMRFHIQFCWFEDVIFWKKNSFILLQCILYLLGNFVLCIPHLWTVIFENVFKNLPCFAVVMLLLHIHSLLLMLLEASSCDLWILGGYICVYRKCICINWCHVPISDPLFKRGIYT